MHEQEPHIDQEMEQEGVQIEVRDNGAEQGKAEATKEVMQVLRTGKGEDIERLKLYTKSLGIDLNSMATLETIALLGFGEERNVEQAKLLAKSLPAIVAESEEVREAVLNNWRGEGGANFTDAHVDEMLGAFKLSVEVLKNDEKIQQSLATAIAQKLEHHNVPDAKHYLERYFDAAHCNEYCVRTLRSALMAEGAWRMHSSQALQAQFDEVRALLPEHIVREP